jgi:hypothetical protein
MAAELSRHGAIHAGVVDGAHAYRTVFRDAVHHRKAQLLACHRANELLDDILHGGMQHMQHNRTRVAEEIA